MHQFATSQLETLFNAMAGVLETSHIPWRNVIGFASDNASVMVGKKNSVLSRVIQQQPDVFPVDCVTSLPYMLQQA